MREYVVKLPALAYEYEDALDDMIERCWGDNRARLQEIRDALRAASAKA